MASVALTSSNTRKGPLAGNGLGILAGTVVGLASAAASAGADVASIEALMNMPVVVSAKDASRLFDSPLNAYIFDEETIQNLPVHSIPELLRYAPGVHVMRVDNGTWGIGIRGMNSRMFGRTSFTIDDQNVNASMFSGLHGSQFDLLMPDIAAVEVVYGPGGILWHNNGGNGGINVVMKTAFETQGSYGQIQAGSHKRAIEGRHGWSIDDQSAMRVFGKYSLREPSSGLAEADDWRQTARAGLRYDLRWTSDDLLSLTADIHGSRKNDFTWDTMSEEELRAARSFGTAGTEKFSSIDLRAKWLRQISDDEGFTLKAWTTFMETEAYYADYSLLVMGAAGDTRIRLADEIQM